ncbi:MAG TPA: hypothetical protein VJQ25_10315, partial [Nitrospira sp.]|nr:hypothetical protein [Nitrospira sp.]
LGPISRGANFSSGDPDISTDGRYIAFSSWATNLVSGDTIDKRDVFVFDRQTGRTDRVSVHSSGAQAQADSVYPSISDDGRFVAFKSPATNLVDNDTNAKWDIFVRDRQSGQTIRVSVDSNGVQGNQDSHEPAISANGRFVAFQSDADNLVIQDHNNVSDVFVHDQQTGLTERISVEFNGLEANGGSYKPTLSANGQYGAFTSRASNLVSGDANGWGDIFVYDRQNGLTERISIDSNGSEANGDSWTPVISADGRFVAFDSDASNLVSGDTNNTADVFVHDRQTGLTFRASVNSNGEQSNGVSSQAAISGDGRFVAFSSSAGDLVAEDTNEKTDVFIHDNQTGLTELASVGSNGAISNGYSYDPSLSGDGTYIAFDSIATNLVS